MILNATDGQFDDHKNRNKLDNRKENLRFCSNSQNHANSKKRKNTFSKYKGVTFRKDAQYWVARITVEKTVINLGSFYSDVEAAVAYNKAAIKYFGEFARLNLIENYMEKE